MNDNEFLLFDRLEKIKSTIKDESQFYISYSGGKDSNVLSFLIDMALPGNTIPRVYIDTGIEYRAVREFVLEKQKTDPRIEVIRSGVKIIQMLREHGYPFKSKLHSEIVRRYQHSGKIQYVRRYLGEIPTKNGYYLHGDHASPECLKYQFEPEFDIPISDKCCYYMKKSPDKAYRKRTGRSIKVVGITHDEGRVRAYSSKCVVLAKDGKIKAFQPLVPVTKEWEDWLIEKYQIPLPKLYYPPYNFERTGCKGCPFALKLQHELDVMENLMPSEKKQCEIIWAPVYAEYRRLGYRLRPVDEDQTMIPGLEGMK